jgi:hypothetical protein
MTALDGSGLEGHEAPHGSPRDIAAGYWIIVHRDLHRAPCVRAVTDWTVEPRRAARPDRRE